MEKFDLENLPRPVTEHIQQLERVRRDFVANVSHELRTPLTVIRGYLETLSNRPDSDTPIPRAIFEQLYAHSIRMEDIIDDLLLLSSLENDEHNDDEFSNVNASKLIEGLAKDAKDISQNQHQFNLEITPNLSINGCEKELKSLFSNLIINAVKYTPNGGIIIIRWHLKDGKASFSVTDTGIGIDPKHIPRLTERFYRVDKARSRDSGGTGLGLAIVKHILMHHDGILNIESTPGIGSTFTCSLKAE